MNALLTAHVIWATINLVIISFYFFSSFAQQGVSLSRTITLILALLYLFLCIQAKRYRKWALAAVLVITFSLAIRWVPMVFVNTYMFYSGHDLYIKSPATIFVVVVYAVLFAIPALFFTIAYMFRYKEIIRRLKKHHT